jgi:hypothetical protein
MQRRYSRNLQSLQFSLRSQEKCHLIENQTFFLPFVPKTHAIEADLFYYNSNDVFCEDKKSVARW